MRTRYAPSPTGLLHVGGLRTALYNELVVRQAGGQFLLRVEDTDQEREVPGAVEDFLGCLAWAGVMPDEGVSLEGGSVTERGDKGPYTQSKRTHLYREHCDQLIEKGHAYRCFCTKERLDEMRKKQEERKQAPMYDRQCLRLPPDDVAAKLAAGEPHVVRLKVPHEKTIEFTDAVRGQVSFKGHTIDDQVLMKSDGFPTYHLANVVDDHGMEIDLVLRGEEWLSSTPKHILLYEAFGWTPPRFGHLPLLLNADKSKLSKRQGSVSVREYIDKGYLPEAMVNFLALLGWNPGTEQEVFTKQELIAQFSLERVQKAGAVFDLQKLDWLQGQWMRKLPVEEFARRCREAAKGELPEVEGDKDFDAKIALIRERVTFFSEAAAMLRPFYRAPESVPVELLANPKQKVTPELLPEILAALVAALEAVPAADWNDQALLALLKAKGEEKGWKLGQILWPLRAALTGQPFSPGATEMAGILGQKETIGRLKKAQRSI
jgi:nondiscriminating glutamyl-tRNA synthetase